MFTQSQSAEKPVPPGLPPSVYTRRQVKTYTAPPWERNGHTYTLTAEARHDDRCNNGHNTFAITGELRDSRARCDGGAIACGCLHDDIAAHFPKLAPLLRWHLCSTDGPLYYIANTVFFAGDRDCRGYRAGEQQRNKSGQLLWVKPTGAVLPHTLAGDGPPTVGAITYVPLLGEGKGRELDAARMSAIWPEATDAELTEPGLEDRLIARLPALMLEFKAAVESLGLVY